MPQWPGLDARGYAGSVSAVRKSPESAKAFPHGPQIARRSCGAHRQTTTGDGFQNRRARQHFYRRPSPITIRSGSRGRFIQIRTRVRGVGVEAHKTSSYSTVETTTTPEGVSRSPSKAGGPLGATEPAAPSVISVSPSISARQPTEMQEDVDRMRGPRTGSGGTPPSRSEMKISEFGGEILHVSVIGVACS